MSPRLSDRKPARIVVHSAIRNPQSAPGLFRNPRSALSFILLLMFCGLIAGGSTLLTRSALGQTSFADPAFQVVWDRTDGLVAATLVKRPWIWGPTPGATQREPFAGLPDNSHLVQYFDKGRMEINDPNGDKSDPFYVTNGLLSVELISGLLQTGVSTFESRSPSTINLASDVDDPSAPTYQSFNGVASIPGAPASRRKTDQTGQTVRTAIDRQGVTQPWPSNHADYGVRIVRFEEATGHNIPDVFWEYLNQQTDIIQDGEAVKGPLFYPWFGITGYPISEPYWSYVKVEGKYTDVLIQAYERRVLTYVPHLPSPFKVQMGNIGQHYYDWRYKSVGAATPRPGVPTPTSATLPLTPPITIDSISYRASIIDLNGTFCTITNRDKEAHTLDGWWLDSPKWSHVDRFYFPNGVTIQPSASIKVHSGPSNNTATDIYMSRTTVMWDSQPYDYAVLYDNNGRQVSDYFPAGDTGPPPTVPPANTPAPGGKPTAPPQATRPGGGPTATRTSNVPPPVETVPSGANTPTRAAASATRATTTTTPTPGTASPTATATQVGTRP